MLNDVFIAQKRIDRCIAGVDNKTTRRDYSFKFNLLTVYGIYVFKLLVLIHNHYSDILHNKDFHSYDTRFKNNLCIPKHNLASTNKTFMVFWSKDI